MPKKKVYISSTFKDLKEYRSVVKNLFDNQLSEQFELCKIMERMWDDGSQTPFVDECIREVKASDIYVLILGNKVGSFPPNESRTYTEIELDTALAGTQKVFMFRYAEFDDSQIDNSIKHRELLQKFDGKPTHSFSNVAELKADLLECLVPHIENKNHANNKQVESVYGVLNELPENYLGRAEELSFIQNFFDKKDNIASKELTVFGEGGLGKTSLITKYLLQNQFHYKYYIFLFCENGIIPELEKLALLRLPKYNELSESDRILELGGYLNNMVLDNRGIILFDNVNIESHWKAFKKQYGLLTWDKLISSRVKSLTTNELDLRPLPEDEALELFYLYYSHEDRNSTEGIVKQLLASMFYNTLLIEIFAKVLDQHYGLFDEGLEVFIEKFKEKGIFNSIEYDYVVDTQYSKNIHKYDADQVGEILNVMYDVAGLSAQQKEILQALALLPTSKHRIANLIDLFNPADKVAFYNLLKSMSAWITIDNHNLSMKDLVQEMLLRSCEGSLTQLQTDILAILCDKIDETQTDVAKIIQIYLPLANGVLKNACRVEDSMTELMFDLAEDIQYFEKNVLKGGDDAQEVFENYQLFIETQEAGNGHSRVFINLYGEFVDICINAKHYNEAIEYQKLLVAYEKEKMSNPKNYATILKKLISIYELKFN